MEKLILRGVMWGADKIPDRVFEKIPGGFYKPEDEDDKRQVQKSEDMKKRRSSRRHSEDDDYYEDDRRSRRNDRDDGYRSDGHGQGRHSRSYDGSDDAYDTVNDRPRRRRSRADIYRNGGNGDRSKRPQREHRNGGSDLNGGFSYHSGPVEPPLSPVSPQAATSAAAMGGIFPGAPSPMYSNPGSSLAPPVQPNPASQSTSTLRGGMATGYVPYANIYGQPQQAQYAPPASDTGSVQPNFLNQVAPPVAKQPYQQNPFAQDAPPLQQPGYMMPDPYFNARHFDEHREDRYDNDDVETERPYSRSPSRRHSRRGDYSPNSYDTRSDLRRARSQRRHDDRPPPGRGKSGIREAFDTSQRGLGYSAVGALAGGLVGSEIGKGKIPAAVGAAVGALGANVFQARENRKRDERRKSEHPRDDLHRDGKTGYYSD